jgi:hypothetical protein
MTLTEKNNCSDPNQVTLLKEILSNLLLYQHCAGVDSKLIILQIIFYAVLIFLRTI